MAPNGKEFLFTIRGPYYSSTHRLSGASMEVIRDLCRCDHDADVASYLQLCGSHWSSKVSSYVLGCFSDGDFFDSYSLWEWIRAFADGNRLCGKSNVEDCALIDIFNLTDLLWKIKKCLP